MVLTVYKLDASPPARSVLMVVEALKIPDVKFVDIDLVAGDHLKEEYVLKNPQHTIPMIEDDDFVVWDSHAIASYLITKYGKDDSLYPTDPKKRATIDQRLHFDSGILFARLKNLVFPVLFLGQKAYREEHIEQVHGAYDLAEAIISSKWMAGDEFTLADICCGTSISSMNEIIPFDSNKYPKLAAWLKRCSELEIYKKCNHPGAVALGQLMKSKTG